MSRDELADEAAVEPPNLADELLPDLILLGVSLGIQVAALVLLSNRDALSRGWVRLHRALSARGEAERQDVAVAQFRRSISAWEHEQAGR